MTTPWPPEDRSTHTAADAAAYENWRSKWAGEEPEDVDYDQYDAAYDEDYEAGRIYNPGEEPEDS